MDRKVAERPHQREVAERPHGVSTNRLATQQPGGRQSLAQRVSAGKAGATGPSPVRGGTNVLHAPEIVLFMMLGHGMKR